MQLGDAESLDGDQRSVSRGWRELWASGSAVGGPRGLSGVSMAEHVLL
eukprot:COSAG01_NODE_6600_length_3585_cov_155.033276_5_plen_48_part_00